jgi:hypothetical protein
MMPNPIKNKQDASMVMHYKNIKTPSYINNNVPCCCKIQDRFVIELRKLFCCFKVGQIYHGRRHESQIVEVVGNCFVAIAATGDIKISSTTSNM